MSGEEENDLEKKIENLRLTYDALIFEMLLYQNMILFDLFKEKIDVKKVFKSLAESKQCVTKLQEDEIIFVRALHGKEHS